MSPAADWLEQLEARLEQQLEAFLRANPAQEALLNEQERRDQQQRQHQQLLQAEALRSELLQIASGVREWRDRSVRARSAGAADLAAKADRQVAQLMERGRLRWQALEQLGQAVHNTNPGSPAHDPLDQAWARFEVDQELEALRRRQQRGR
jgi:hercynine metabolism protein